MTDIVGECLGTELGFSECNGPSYEIKQGLGQNACASCLVVAYKGALVEIAGHEDEKAILREQAEIDSLTELLNRRMLDSAIAEKIKGNEHFAIMFIDIENFKEVNHREKHVGGDKVLRETASFLYRLFSTNLRREDVIARYGGDEFVAILQSRVGDELCKSDLEMVKSRLIEGYNETAIATQYNGKYGNELPIGLHVGYAIHQEGETAEQLLSRADPDTKRKFGDETLASN